MRPRPGWPGLFSPDHNQHAGLLTERIVARGGRPHEALSAEEYARSYPPLASITARSAEGLLANNTSIHSL
jgi:hypothetical protein